MNGETIPMQKSKSELFAERIQSDEKLNAIGPAFRLLVHLLFVGPLGVSTTYAELGQTLGKNKKTIEKWVAILDRNGFLSHERTGNGVAIRLADRYLTIAKASDRILEHREPYPHAANPRFNALQMMFEASELSGRRLKVELVV